jgi:cytidylate kinase
MIIAIDGPAGSGKSSVAKAIAKQLKFRHIDSGAMYRAVAWKSRELGIDLGEQERLAKLAQSIQIEFMPGEDKQEIVVDGKIVTSALRQENIGNLASQVATQERVREALVARQQEISHTGNVVMDGRDIGTVVFPDADIKIFLDASPEVRGQRRHLELQEKGNAPDREHIVEDIRRRDHEDRNRKASPLRPADDAVLIDTTGLGLDEVIEKVLQLIKTKRVQ